MSNKIHPLSHERLKLHFSAVFLPLHPPRRIAKRLTKREKHSIIKMLVDSRAAPNPAANPSKERASASEIDSCADNFLEQSKSALCGSAYTFRMN